MKIAILLPYKENFSPEYPGAVSLFVNATSEKSKYKKEKIHVLEFFSLVELYNLVCYELLLLKIYIFSVYWQNYLRTSWFDC